MRQIKTIDTWKRFCIIDFLMFLIKKDG